MKCSFTKFKVETGFEPEALSTTQATEAMLLQHLRHYFSSLRLVGCKIFWRKEKFPDLREGRKTKIKRE